MKIFGLIVLALLVAAALGLAYLKYRFTHTPDQQNLAVQIDDEIKKYPAHGLVVGIYKNGKTYIKGYGNIGRDSQTVPDGATVFQIASVSKLFTASTLQVLCDEGVVNMDSTLSELIGDTYPLSPKVQNITLRQLATHTSGLPRVPKSLMKQLSSTMSDEEVMKDPYNHFGSETIFAYLKTAEDTGKSGGFEYSNYGMGLLGHILELKTKQPLETLLAQKLLTPLGMNNTAITLTPSMQAHLAQGYTEDDKPAQLWTFKSLAGAGALNSNVEDMLKFVRANIENSPISPSLKKMHAPQIKGDTGIGWMQAGTIDKWIGNNGMIWHNGMVGGYASYVSIDTQAKTGLVVLSNKAVDVTMLGMMLTHTVRTQSWSTKQTF